MPVVAVAIAAVSWLVFGAESRQASAGWPMFVERRRIAIRSPLADDYAGPGLPGSSYRKPLAFRSE